MREGTVMEFSHKVMRLQATDLQSLFSNAAPASAFAVCPGCTPPGVQSGKETAMLGPMTPLTDAVLARAMEEAAVREQEEQRRKEKDPRVDPPEKQDDTT